MFLIDKKFWEVRKTNDKGLGVFAKREITKGTVIGDYLGKLIRNADYDVELEKNGVYLMYLTDEASIYPDLKKQGLHLFNHSCEPNCAFYLYRGHILFFAIENIEAGSELTISYMISPKEYCTNCTHYCMCGSLNCTGTLHLTKREYAKWDRYQKEHKRKSVFPKSAFGKDFPKLKNYPKVVSGWPPYLNNF